MKGEGLQDHQYCMVDSSLTATVMETEMVDSLIIATVMETADSSVMKMVMEMTDGSVMETERLSFRDRVFEP